MHAGVYLHLLLASMLDQGLANLVQNIHQAGFYFSGPAFVAMLEVI